MRDKRKEIQPTVAPLIFFTPSSAISVRGDGATCDASERILPQLWLGHAQVFDRPSQGNTGKQFLGFFGTIGGNTVVAE